MKKILFLLLLSIPGVSFASAYDSAMSHQCKVSSAEKLVCEVLLCNPLGLIDKEARPKCLDVNMKFGIYLSTLGFWGKPPKCYGRDPLCNKTGKAQKATSLEKICDGLDEKEKIACEQGKQFNDAGCDELEGEAQKKCYVDLAIRTGKCDELSSTMKLMCEGFDPVSVVNAANDDAKKSCGAEPDLLADLSALDACIIDRTKSYAQNACSTFPGDASACLVGVNDQLVAAGFY